MCAKGKEGRGGECMSGVKGQMSTGCLGRGKGNVLRDSQQVWLDIGRGMCVWVSVCVRQVERNREGVFRADQIWRV